jgi:hypothetical protein
LLKDAILVKRASSGPAPPTQLPTQPRLSVDYWWNPLRHYCGPEQLQNVASVLDCFFRADRLHVDSDVPLPHIDLAAKFGFEFNDGKTLVNGPQRPAHVLAALRFDLQAFSIGSDTCYLGKQGRPVSQVFLLHLNCCLGDD